MKKMYVLSILEKPEMVSNDKNKLCEYLKNNLLTSGWNDEDIAEIIDSLNEYGEYSFGDDEPVAYMISEVEII